MNELRQEIKKWLKDNGKSYNWLAEQCSVKYNTVRNWMSQTPIPPAKESLIRILFSDKIDCNKKPQRPSANGISLITVPFSTGELELVEHAARIQGITIEQFIVNSVEKDIKGELNIPNTSIPVKSQNKSNMEPLIGKANGLDIA